ncbi:Uncharacterised protein [Mycobacteroides abscessus subsp. massiliense]|nr:Uncharacterised protein [Mycobacteroides abscessus subsp. massiliense]
MQPDDEGQIRGAGIRIALCHELLPRATDPSRYEYRMAQAGHGKQLGDTLQGTDDDGLGVGQRGQWLSSSRVGWAGVIPGGLGGRYPGWAGRALSRVGWAAMRPTPCHRNLESFAEHVISKVNP